ncbi:beta-propeller domain-containing protein [Aurantiacibacter gilvus]|uniref:Beta-propeller domain-containing protein n=1 Tax=Aurantiacibacter gilvus TaxID=3139141 RepID=A0ABU9IDL2_9SPHN
MVRFAKAYVPAGCALVLLAGCSDLSLEPVQGTVPSSETVSSFESEEELDQFAQAMLALRERNDRAQSQVEYLESPAMYDIAEPEPPANESITNTQEAGVDEGGIVKNVGDYLVVLRRGRLFTVRVGGDALAPLDAIDAFPPGAEGYGAWYDEMLVRGSEVIVIGYSYSAGGTELNRFRVGRDGSLTYRDTHYLKSGDYYSSSNYASRLIGDQLVFYTPLYMNWQGWRESLPTLRTRQQDGSLDEGVVLATAEDIHISNVYRDAGAAPAMLHTVTRCDLAAEEMTCEAYAVLGDWSRTFYVSRDAV